MIWPFSAPIWISPSSVKSSSQALPSSLPYSRYIVHFPSSHRALAERSEAFCPSFAALVEASCELSAPDLGGVVVRGVGDFGGSKTFRHSSIPLSVHVCSNLEASARSVARSTVTDPLPLTTIPLPEP